MVTVSCKCGCGICFSERDNHNRTRKYSPGHHRRGIPKPAEWKRMMSHRMLGSKNHQWNPSREKVGRRKGNDFTKKQIRELRKDICLKCGATDNLQLDHIVPCFAGGTNDVRNAQTLCGLCNNKKRDADYRLYRKWGEFRGPPKKDNPEPSLNGNVLEGATASIRVS